VLSISYFRVFGSKCFILVKRGRKSKFAPKTVEGFLLGYDSNTRAYRVFNKSSGQVEVSCDVVFDETNGSQVEQVDLVEIGDEEAPCIALRNMSIGDVCPKESEEPPHAQDQSSSSTQASPPTQNEDEAQNDEGEDQGNEPPQDDGNDQVGDANNQDKEDEEPRPPHLRVHQAIQRDHPVDTILGDIHKGVTTRSRVAHFCEHYSFDSSIEPHRVEEAVRAKAKTPPFARCLRQPRCTNGDRTTGRLTLRPTRRRTKTCDEVVSSRSLIQHGGPRVIRPSVTGPAWPLRITGLICKGLPVIKVCNPTLWEYSGDNLGA
jgi:hypothetical protein